MKASKSPKVATSPRWWRSCKSTRAKAAIERNREIIPKSLYASTPLMEGDEVEIVGFIGGG